MTSKNEDLLKALRKATKDRETTLAKIASLEVARTEALAGFDSKIKAAKLSLLSCQKAVEDAARALVNPSREAA